MKLTHWLAVAAISIAGHSAQASTFSDPFSSFWALGDSLTDNGNLFAVAPEIIPSPPYFEGRVSSGPTFAEYLADDFAAQGKPNGNLAFAGAQAVTNADMIPDLAAQVGLLSLQAPNFGDRPLVSLFFGSNDVLGAFSAGQNPVSAASDAADAVLGAVTDLRALGIHDFLMFGLPDFARIPRLNDEAPEVQGLATFAGQTFDMTLAGGLALLPADLQVTKIDVSGALADILDNPGLLGLTNTRDSCLTLDGVCANAEQFAFFDDIHPTGTVHLALADVVRAAYIAPIPLPAAGWALLLALAGLAVAGRRRHMA